MNFLRALLKRPPASKPAETAPAPAAAAAPAVVDLLPGLVPASHLGRVAPRDGGGVLVEGGAQPWAFAALAPFAFQGRALVSVVGAGLSGRMSVGLVNHDRSEVFGEQVFSGAPGQKIFISVNEAADYAGVLFRTHMDGAQAPAAAIETVSIQPMRPYLDPLLESLWPLDRPEHSMGSIYGWSRQDLEAQKTGDRWIDNALVNKWEFVHGAAELTSFPTRFSVPFVLCNARCDFCSAWLANAEPMPVGLIDGVKDALPYLSEIDLVGWGEPLIHPQLEDILKKLRDYCDPRARISLTTNGVHLKKWAAKLLEAGVSDISISIHAATPQTHEDLMGLPAGAFAKVIEGIEAIAAARAAGRKVRLSMTFIVTKQNIGEIPEFVALGERLGVDQLFFRTLKPQTMQEEDMQGLDYHRLPAYLHEDFEGARARAVEALARTKVHCDAQPETWSAPVFPKETEAEILARPLTPRSVRRADKALRFDPTPDSPDLPRGEPLAADAATPAGPGTQPAAGGAGGQGESESGKGGGEEGGDDGEDNPYGRSAPYRCPSPYTALYLSGFNRKVTPCCYMTHVPGFQPAYLRTGVDYHAELLNSPAMVELRRSLDEGELKSPCLKCPFYW